MIVNRPPNRLFEERKLQEKKRIQAEQDGSPIPISMVGGGRGGSLIAFTEGTGKNSQA